MDESGRLESGYSGLNRNRGFESLSPTIQKEILIMIKCFVALSLLMYGTVQAMTFDNRFLPLLLKPFNRRCDALSHFSIQPFFMNADHAFHEASRLSIPDIDGTYDTAVLARALVAAEFDNPLRSDLQLRPSIPWSRKGRLNALKALHSCMNYRSVVFL